MLLLRAVHVSSTFEFGAVFYDCLSPDPHGNPPFSPFSEPHEYYCLALFMCPPFSSLQPHELIAKCWSSILHPQILSEAP